MFSATKKPGDCSILVPVLCYVNDFSSLHCTPLMLKLREIVQIKTSDCLLIVSHFAPGSSPVCCRAAAIVWCTQPNPTTPSLCIVVVAAAA